MNIPFASGNNVYEVIIMSKKIEGCNGKKVSRKKLKKWCKKMKKETKKFLKLCGMSKKDIRIAMQTGEAPDFKDIDELEFVAVEAIGPALSKEIGIL